MGASVPLGGQRSRPRHGSRQGTSADGHAICCCVHSCESQCVTPRHCRGERRARMPQISSRVPWVAQDTAGCMPQPWLTSTQLLAQKRQNRACRLLMAFHGWQGEEAMWLRSKTLGCCQTPGQCVAGALAEAAHSHGTMATWAVYCQGSLKPPPPDIWGRSGHVDDTQMGDSKCASVRAGHLCGSSCQQLPQRALLQVQSNGDDGGSSSRKTGRVTNKEATSHTPLSAYNSSECCANVVGSQGTHFQTSAHTTHASLETWQIEHWSMRPQ